jgi:hypothetical protein
MLWLKEEAEAIRAVVNKLEQGIVTEDLASQKHTKLWSYDWLVELFKVSVWN